MKKNLLILFLSLFQLSLYAQETIVKENLGPSVNSSYGEGNPVITPDGRTIFFSVWNHPSNYGPDHDTWMAQLDSSTQTFKPRYHPSSPLNKEGKNNSVECTNPDGSIIYIRGTFVGGMYVTKGFSYVKKVANGYSIPMRLNIKDYSTMAQGQYSNINISADGQVMLLSFSEKPDATYGDLYVSFRESEINWSRPAYITSINTKKFDESTPFIASDGKTIYFSSNREGGLGNNDIYMAKRLDNTWLNWSTPVNLGPSVNTPDWDAYYKISAKGDFAYMVSSNDPNGYGSSDIIRIRVVEAMKPEPVVLIRGKVVDKKTSQPLSADIVYSEFGSNKVIGQTISDPATGEYTIILPYGKKYDYRAQAKGYFPEANNIDLGKVASYQEQVHNLYMTPVEAGQTVRLNNVLFEFGKAQLIPESNAELNRIAELLKANSTVEIQLGGHTDDQGSDDYNLKLSQDRVDAIRQYLLNQGIAANRITSVGYGETKPLVPNDNDDNRQLNRRVEFVIVKM
ncbi:MAG: OmpA family protein [Cytophagaceae bacterium]